LPVEAHRHHLDRGRQLQAIKEQIEHGGRTSVQTAVH
jgi:hypothetical protein